MSPGLIQQLRVCQVVCGPLSQSALHTTALPSSLHSVRGPPTRAPNPHCVCVLRSSQQRAPNSQSFPLHPCMQRETPLTPSSMDWRSPAPPSRTRGLGLPPPIHLSFNSSSSRHTPFTPSPPKTTRSTTAAFARLLESAKLSSTPAVRDTSGLTHER